MSLSSWGTYPTPPREATLLHTGGGGLGRFARLVSPPCTHSWAYRGGLGQILQLTSMTCERLVHLVHSGLETVCNVSNGARVSFCPRSESLTSVFQAQERLDAVVLPQEGPLPPRRLLLEEEEGREDHARRPHEAQSPGNGGEPASNFF